MLFRELPKKRQDVVLFTLRRNIGQVDEGRRGGMEE
jgi:hypothetical protein